MKRLDYLVSARRDLADIFDYIAAADPDAAVRVLERIYAAAVRLEDYPESAPARPEIGAVVRSFVVGNYLVLYRIGADSVDVVRVVHGARDVKGLIVGGGEDE